MEHTISIIGNKRYTKLSSLYLYFYICIGESFRNLKENSDDLENVGSFITHTTSSPRLTMDDINKYLSEHNISSEHIGMGIILFKVRYNDEREDRLEDLYQWTKDQGYEYEDPIYEEDDEYLGI